ncbi:MAG: hypothetical protein HC880_21520 [Bacteroidia bacterium]|nr:hypothetical protein [Bacteroidia bacterium]
MRRLIVGSTGVLLLFLLLDTLFPLNNKVSYSPIIHARDSTILHAYLSQDDKWRLKTELSEIIPPLRTTLIYKEDKYFYYHFGINPAAVARALITNLFHLKTTSGASTITMQVARLLDPKPRTYANKFVEMFNALQLEWHYSKAEILQMYLNLVPYGGNIEGVKSAALLYFKRLPRQLSLAQIVTLAIIPNRPTSLVLGKRNDYILQERNKWLRRFAQDRIFPTEALRNALEEPLEVARQAPPQLAPHFCQRVHLENPQAISLYTSLDIQKQEKFSNWFKTMYAACISLVYSMPPCWWSTTIPIK